MHSLISIVVVVLSGKENYHECFRKIKHTLIFNDLWKGICEGEGHNALENPTLDKLSIWENTNNKVYALIATSVNEEVSHHIFHFQMIFKIAFLVRKLYHTGCTDMVSPQCVFSYVL